MKNVPRKRVLQGLASGALLVVAGQPASPQPINASDRDVIMIIRHAEKPDHAGSPYGVDDEGVINAGSLTVRGWTRAGALANGFMYPARWKLPVPSAIYASQPGEEKARRAFETVLPLAKLCGIDVDTSFRRGDEAMLAAALLAGRGARLVAWEHHAIPAITAHLGTVSPPLKGLWQTDRYDVIWSFERDGSSWNFRPVAQRLLAGDKPTA